LAKFGESLAPLQAAPIADSAGSPRLSGLRSIPMPDRCTPFDLTGEKETLLQFLDYLRESIILKVDDLDEEVARTSTVPSGTSLLGLVRHLTIVELTWFQLALAGLDTPFPSEAIEPTDTVARVVDSYRATIATNNAIVDAYSDLDHLCARAITTPEPPSLRWLLVHMVEETARHAGHADILREQLDGQTGR
jgi:uncharacterized damage-inducible protein DinB